MKTAIILPFFQALGYDVFNPSEVMPEFISDAVGKKGEKVDYAIKVDDQIRILVECKSLTTRLEKVHLSQLFRYFTVTSARFAILTNGQQFQFYSDLEEPNKLDSRPFFVFDITDYPPQSLLELKKFEKGEFDVEGILATADRLKYTALVKAEINKLIEDPSEDFTRVISSALHDGRWTAATAERFGGFVRTAFREVIRDSVHSRLSSALAESDLTGDEGVNDIASVDEIITTEEEREGFLMIRAIVRDTISANRVIIRDQKSYCGVLIDDNNRRPLARLHLNRGVKYISLFDTGSEDKIAIGSLDDIYSYAGRLRATAAKYTHTESGSQGATISQAPEIQSTADG